MPLYENCDNAENKIKIEKEWRNLIALGPEETIQSVVTLIRKHAQKEGRLATIGFDGWYGVDWEAIKTAIEQEALKEGVKVVLQHINAVFKPIEEIDQYKTAFISDDPSFGVVNTDGLMHDLMDSTELQALNSKLQQIQAGKESSSASLIIYGSGSTVAELNDAYDFRFYFDKTRQQMLWQMWGGSLVPFAMDKPKKDYNWKEYYYCDHYLLHHQKDYAIEHMDFYIEAVEF